MEDKTIELQAKLIQVGNVYAEQNLIRHNTPAARKMEAELKRLKIPYQRECPVIVYPKKEGSKTKPKLYILDFYIKQPLNFAIEVDGGYHKKLTQKEKDAIRDEAIEVHGMGKTFRFTNEEVLSDRFSLVSEIIYVKSLRSIFSAHWAITNPNAPPLAKSKKAGNKRSVYSNGEYLSKRDYWYKYNKKKRKGKKRK